MPIVVVKRAAIGPFEDVVVIVVLEPDPIAAHGAVVFKESPPDPTDEKVVLHSTWNKENRKTIQFLLFLLTLSTALVFKDVRRFKTFSKKSVNFPIFLRGYRWNMGWNIGKKWSSPTFWTLSASVSHSVLIFPPPSGISFAATIAHSLWMDTKSARGSPLSVETSLLHAASASVWVLFSRPET